MTHTNPDVGKIIMACFLIIVGSHMSSQKGGEG